MWCPNGGTVREDCEAFKIWSPAGGSGSVGGGQYVVTWAWRFCSWALLCVHSLLPEYGQIQRDHPASFSYYHAFPPWVTVSLQTVSQNKLFVIRYFVTTREVTNTHIKPFVPLASSVVVIHNQSQGTDIRLFLRLGVQTEAQTCSHATSPHFVPWKSPKLGCIDPAQVGNGSRSQLNPQLMLLP